MKSMVLLAKVAPLSMQRHSLCLMTRPIFLTCWMLAEHRLNWPNYKVNTGCMNPVDASLLRRVKDSSGQPIVQTLVDGTPTIGGLRLITTNKLTKGTMLVSDDSLIQIWTKRGLEMKVGQYATDAEKDQYTALMFARVQCLVEDADKAGVIYVASIADSISAIDKAV